MTLSLSRLPRLDIGVADLMNRFAARQEPFNIDLTQTIEGPCPVLSLRPAPAGIGPAKMVVVAIKTDAGRFSIYLDPACLDLICDHVLPGWRQENLPLDWRAVCVLATAVTAAGMDGLHPTYGEVAFSDCRSLAETPCAMSWRLTLGETDFPAWLRIDEADPAQLWRAMPSGGLSHPPARLPYHAFPLHLTAHGASCLRADLAGLCLGDVLLVAGPASAGVPVTGHIPAIARLMGHLGPDGRLSVATLVKGSFTMTDQPQTDDDWTEASAPDTGQDHLGDLPVKLDFQLHSCTIRLQELAALGPGSSLDLGADLTGPVRIRADGRTVGFGRLVGIGDRVGVQIERWQLSDD